MKTRLLLAIHNHQPVGNFEHVFEMAFQKSYKPFISAIAGRDIRISLHISGPLIDYIEKNHPSFIDTLASLVDSGQIEMLSGGYYEPILASIPYDDAVGQLNMMNNYLKRRFGKSPLGFWLTERIFDESVIDMANDSGLKYTVVDDSHLFYSGKSYEDIFSPWITERHGKTLTVFPVDHNLRLKIPFAEVSEIEKYILNVRNSTNADTLFFGDDGEKFGVWPGTNKWVYNDGWMKRFIDLVENSDEITTETYGNIFKEKAPKGRVYLSPTSYEEMMEWALPVNLQEQFVKLKGDIKKGPEWIRFANFLKGGMWNNFFQKYPESNLMHKRALILSRRLKIAESDLKSKKSKKAIEKVEKAKEHLYQSQCNCAYWHGLFGGVYLNYLRDAIYRNIIQGENLLMRGDPEERVLRGDILSNGGEQILFRNGEISLGINDEGNVFIMENRKKAFSL